MDGIAFSIFGFDVYWYGLIIMMGILVGIVISTKLSKIRGYSSDMILDFILLAVPLGVIGARLYYVVFSNTTSESRTRSNSKRTRLKTAPNATLH